MADSDGHKNTHAPPKGGWPTFDKDGKVVKEIESVPCGSDEGV